MTSNGQLQMFEPEGKALPPLVSHYLKTHDVQFKRAENLQLAGFESTASSLFLEATAAFKNAQICEMAFQFETEAGLQ